MKTYAELLQIDPIIYDDQEKLSFVGKLVDLSSDNQDIKGTEKAIGIATNIKPENLTPAEQARLHYFQANAWANMRHFRRFQRQAAWDYDQEELTHEIFHLRSALRSEGLDDLQQIVKCQIFTNSGNVCSHIGRFVEAQENWRSALEIDRNFPMALGNIGQGCFSYGRSVYDEAHRNIFIYHAYQYLGRALPFRQHVSPGAYEHWKKMRESIAERWPGSYLNKEHSFNHFDLGKNKALRNYRQWCLNERLYVNPLNDLGNYTEASHDVLHLPNMTVAAGEPPKYHTLFNQIKQEYATARFLFYDGTSPHTQHYSDTDVRLVDTSDYTEYSYHVEKIKIAFRLIYSLFDKIAYLLNDYLKIGLTRKSISFKNLWHENVKGKKSLRMQFQNNNNLALRGLYWLSKDLLNAEDEEAHDDALEPEARELAEIRNHIEHKSFKVVQYGTWGHDDADGYAFSIGRSKFELKTLRMMKLVRSAIIYTSLAIHHEEGQRSIKGPSLPVVLPDLLFQNKV